MKFVIEQIALAPPDPVAAKRLMMTLGLSEWIDDTVTASGAVGANKDVVNVASLAFNYQAASSANDMLELEILQYKVGDNWLDNANRGPCVSHLGMHCTMNELEWWKEKFKKAGIPIAQEVDTISHTNATIAGKRWYRYCIFATHKILGVDLKFIVRKNTP